METILGVSCIKGEIHSLITLMRLNTRWSSKTYRRDSYCQEDPLIENFQRLNIYLEGVIDLQDVDCVSYVLPFYHLVISEQAGSAITSAALSSLSKFALYGFFSPQFPKVQEAMALIARCISHCVFEETDWESDELILMKLLELATLCFRCHASSLLSAESAWDVFSTCKSIHEHYRASKILKNEAESALVHLTLNTFSRASHMILKFGITKDSLFTTVDPKMCFLSDTKGISLILLNIVRVISTMMEQQQPESVKLALTLINVALEAGGLALSHIDPLVDALCNDLCRHLLRATQSEDLGIFSCALRVVFNLFMSMKDNMKVQLEVFLTSVHLRILNNSAAFAREELTLESLLEFCREPTLMQDLYVNYDCDVRCTNLFDSIIQALCRRATLDLISNHQKLIDINGNPGQQQFNSITMDSSVLADQFLQISNGSHFNGNYSYSGESSPTIKRLTIIHRLSFEGIATILHGMIGRHDELNGRKRKMLLRGRGMTMSTTEHFMAVTKTGLDGEDMLETEIDKWCEDMSEADLLSQDADEDVAGSRMSVPASPTGKQPCGLPALRSITSHPPSLSASPLSIMIPRVLSHSSGANMKGLGIGDGSDIWEQSSDPGSVNSATNMVDRENEMTQSIMERMKKAELLRKRKYMKQKIKSVAESFNQKPMKNEWLQMACDVGLIELLAITDDSKNKKEEIIVDNNVDRNIFESQEIISIPTEMHTTADNNTTNDPNLPPESTVTTTLNSNTNFSDSKKLPTLQESNPVGADPKSVAMFLKASPGLGKAQIGEFISKGPADLFPFHAAVLQAYVQTFSFIHPDGVTVMTFDQALRTFLSSFRLPGEAQCIDRIMEAFAGRYFEHLQPGQPFASADAVFILSFSTILLNTDLHNPQVPQHKKMTKEQFIRNNRGINDGKDLPRAYLEQLYDYIKSTQIQVHIDVNEPQPLQGGKSALIDLSDPTAWQKMIAKIAQDQAPAEFTPIASVRLFHQLRKRLLPQQPPPSQGLEDDGSINSNNVHSTTNSDETLNLHQHHHQHRLVLLDEQNSMVSYHGDMFVTMSKQIFQCIFVLWHHHQYPVPANHITPITANAPDDLFLRRMLLTLTEYSLVCCTYDLYACFNAILQVSLDGCWQVMQNQRRLQHPRSTSISSVSSASTSLSKVNMLLQRSLYDQWRREQPQQSTDLTVLLIKSVDQLLSSRANSSTNSPSAITSLTFVNSSNPSIPISPSQISFDRDKILWTDATLIKAEITFKVLLPMVQSHSPYISSDTWMKILRFLLWCRTRGALPIAMAQIEHGFFSLSSNSNDQISDVSARNTSIISIRYPPSVYAKTRFLTQDRLESGVYRPMLDLATQRYTEYHNAKALDALASGGSTIGHSGDSNNAKGNNNGSWFPSFLWSTNSTSPSTRNNDDYPPEYFHPENGASSLSSMLGATPNSNSRNDNTQLYKHLEKKLKFLKVEEEKSLFGDCNDMRYRSAKDGKPFRTDDWLLNMLLEHANLQTVQTQRLFIFPENDYISSFATIVQQYTFTAQEKDECRRLFQARVSAFIRMLQLTLQRLTKNAIDSLTINLHPTDKAAHYQHLVHTHHQPLQPNEAKFLHQSLPSSTLSGEEERIDEDTETMGSSSIPLDDLFPTSLLQQDSPTISFTEWDAMLILEWLSRFLLHKFPAYSGIPTSSPEPSQHNTKENDTIETNRFNGLLWLTFGQRIIDLLMLLLRNESDVLIQYNLHLFLERCVVVSFQVIHTAVVFHHEMWASLSIQEAEVMWSSTWKLLRWMQDLPGHVKEKLKDVLAAGIYSTLRQIHHYYDVHHPNGNTKEASHHDAVSSEQWALLLSLLSTCLFTSEHDFSVSASSAPSLTNVGAGATATLVPAVNHAREAYRFLVTELLNTVNYPLLRHLTVHLVSSRIAEGPNTVDWSMEEVQLLQADMKQLLQLTLVAMASHRQTAQLEKQLQKKQQTHNNITHNDDYYGKKMEQESSMMMLPVSSSTASSVWQTPQKISAMIVDNTRLPATPVTPSTPQIRGMLSFGSPSSPASPASSKPASPLKQQPLHNSTSQHTNPLFPQQYTIDDKSEGIEEIVSQASFAKKITFRGMRSSIVQHQNNPHLTVILPECTVHTLPHLYPLQHSRTPNNNFITNHHVPPTENVINIWMSTALLFADWTGASHSHLAQTALQALEMLVCAAEEDEEKEVSYEKGQLQEQYDYNGNHAQSIAALSKYGKKPSCFSSKLLLQLLEEMLLRVPLQLSPVPAQIKMLPVATQATQLFVHMILLHLHTWRQETMDNNNTNNCINNERVVTFFVRIVTALAANLTLIPHQQAKMNPSNSDSSANPTVVNTLGQESTVTTVVIASDDLLSQLCTMFRLFPLPTLSQPQANPTVPFANATSVATNNKSNIVQNNNHSSQLQSSNSSAQATTQTVTNNHANNPSLFSYINPLSYIFSAPPPPTKPNVNPNSPAPYVAHSSATETAVTQTAPVHAGAESLGDTPVTDTIAATTTTISEGDVALVALAYKAALAVNPALATLLHHFDPALLRSLQECLKLRDQQQQQQQQVLSAAHSIGVGHPQDSVFTINPAASEASTSTIHVSHRVHVADLAMHHQPHSQQPVTHQSSLGIPIIALPSPPPAQQIRPVAIHQLQQQTSHHTAPMQDHLYHNNKFSHTSQTADQQASVFTPSTVTTLSAVYPPMVVLKENSSNNLVNANNNDNNNNSLLPTTISTPTSTLQVQHQQPLLPVSSAHVYTLRPHTDRYPVLTDLRMTPSNNSSNVTMRGKLLTQKDLLASPVQIV